MSRGKYQAKRKPFPVLAVVLLLVLAVSLSSVGVAAYLAKISEKETVNDFEVAPLPTPQVVMEDDIAYVDVGQPGYAVYVRAAVVPNWTASGNVILVAPSDFVITPGDHWVAHTDGFFYYTKPISAGLTSPIYTQVTATGNPGGTMEVDVAVQVIQALGTTDDTPSITAVLDAWGVQPEDLRPNA